MKQHSVGAACELLSLRLKANPLDPCGKPLLLYHGRKRTKYNSATTHLIQNSNNILLICMKLNTHGKLETSIHAS